MPESSTHKHFIENIERYIFHEYRIEKGLVIMDDGSDQIPPKTPEGYRPDLYYEFEGILIIGEAKTIFDIENAHSKSQYDSYLKYCENFEGISNLILSVPMECYAMTKNMLNRLTKNYQLNNFSFKVITDETFVGWNNESNIASKT